MCHEQDVLLAGRTKLDISDILWLLTFVLSNSFFVYNDKKLSANTWLCYVYPCKCSLCQFMHGGHWRTSYSQRHNTPWGLKRFVDDSFAIIKISFVLSFCDTLNSIDPRINFTIEHKQNGWIAFLDTLISRNNCLISIDIYRKPTHTDRYLDYLSHKL